MELRQLHYFLVVSEELHFVRAAQRLHIAQPPLSRQIQQLEKEVGTKLFERTKRSVKLTAAGEYLTKEVTKLFDHVTLIERQLQLINQGTVGQLRIGYVGAVMHSFLPHVLKDLKIQYPQINTVLSEMTNDAQITALKSGQLDIGFIRSPIEANHLITKPLLRETFSIILSFDHPLATRDHISLIDLATEPFICFSRECAPVMVDKIIGICNHAGFSPNKIHESSQINTILRLVESNLGYSIVPSSVRAGYSLSLKYYEMDDISDRAELSLIYNPALITPLIHNVIELFSDYFSTQNKDSL